MNDEYDLVLALDIECDGPSHHLNNLLCIGFALVDIRSGSLVDSGVYYLPPDPRKAPDPVTLDSFWLKEDSLGERPLETTYKHMLAMCKEASMDSMQLFVDRIRLYTTGKKTLLLTDTAGFDASWLNYYLGVPRVGWQDPPSVDFLLLDEGLQMYYNPPFQVTGFFLGVGWKYPSKSPYLSACMALDIPPVAFGVKHDHNPRNDAHLLALRFVHVWKAVRGGGGWIGSRAFC